MTVRVYANTTCADFIEILYRAFQDANMPTPVLDCVEALGDMLDYERQAEEAGEAKRVEEENAQALYDELQALHKAVEYQSELDPSSMSEAVLSALLRAERALKTYEAYK